MARDAAYQADSGDDPADDRRDKLKLKNESTVSAVFKRFVALHLKPNTKNWRDTKRLLEQHVLSVWGTWPMDTISKKHAHELLDDISIQSGVSMAREVRKHSAALFSWAVDRGVLAASPFAGMLRCSPSALMEPISLIA